VPFGLPELVRLWCVKQRARILVVKRYRRLRRLVPDTELIRRRAAGEPLHNSRMLRRTPADHQRRQAGWLS
jgi:hypothetical protein